MERANCRGAVTLYGSCLGVVVREQSSKVKIVRREMVQGVIIWGLIVQAAIITTIQGLNVLGPKFFLKYSSTDHFLSPIPVADWLIFWWGNLIFHQKNS